MRSLLPNALLIALLLFVSDVWATGRQAHLRVGMLKASYSGPVEASFTTFPTMEMEMELFYSAKVSTVIQAVFAMDFGKAKVFYSGVGGGQRFYFGGSSMLFDRQEGDFSLEMYKPHRFFAGYTVGVAQVLVQEFTSAFSVVGSVAEIAASAGYNYQLSKEIGIETMLTFGYGLGFTTVAVNGFNIRAGVGMSYYF